MFELVVTKHFDSAHKLTDYEGKCKHLHGHRWSVEVRIESNALDSKNMLVDFTHIKHVLDALLPDHCYLNDHYGEANPTAEFLAETLFKQLSSMFLGVKQVRVFESPDCSVIYR